MFRTVSNATHDRDRPGLNVNKQHGYSGVTVEFARVVSVSVGAAAAV